MTDQPDTAELENRIDKLESTIEKMMPSRRDALKMAGGALVGGAAMSGTASAGTNQVGTIGSQASPVDLESEDINNADTVTTQNLVVNGTTTGISGGVPANFNYVDETSNRSANTVFTNNSGKALYVSVGIAIGFSGGNIEALLSVNGQTIHRQRHYDNPSIVSMTLQAFVPDGGTYELDLDTGDLSRWIEAEM